MNDLTVTHNGELMVAEIDGDTERGVEFVDSWIGAPLIVPDSGRIVIPESAAEGLVIAAKAADLTVVEIRQ